MTPGRGSPDPFATPSPPPALGPDDAGASGLPRGGVTPRTAPGPTPRALAAFLLVPLALPARAADPPAPGHPGPVHAPSDRAPPDRVVSLNLCADQLLVLLASERVAALSTLSRDPALSHVAARAAALPQVRADAEAVLRLRPGLVLAGRYGAQSTVASLERRGVPVLRLDLPAGFDAIRVQVREVAAALGVPGRGEALIRDMDARLAALPRGQAPPGSPTAGGQAAHGPDGPGPAATAPTAHDPTDPAHATHAPPRAPQAPPRALLWGARGWASGPGTLGDAVLRAAGFENAGAGGVVGLETLLSRPPDLLVTAEAPAFPSLATELLRHPAVAGLPRRTVPPALLICAGPFTALAAEMLAQGPPSGHPQGRAAGAPAP